MEQDFIEEEYCGVITNLELIHYSHARPYAHLTTNVKVNLFDYNNVEISNRTDKEVYFDKNKFVKETTYLYNLLNVGDSISKMKGSNYITIYKGDSIIKYSKKFKCK